jgi:oligopeptide transport system permease protein
MTDEPLATDVRDPQEDPPAPGDVATLRDEARRELGDLAGHWNERLASFDVTDAGDAAGQQRSLLQDAARRFSHNRIAMAGLVLVLAYVLLAIFFPMFSHANSERVLLDQQNLAPSSKHILGTDSQGKDVFLISWLGARISLSIAAAVSMTILLIGVVYGSISGYVGGRLDQVMMRFLDSLYGLPYLPFAIIIVSILADRLPDASPLAYMVPALSLTAWFTSARIVRGQMLSLKQNEYVEGARSAGARSGRIIRKHLLPNTFGIMVVSIFLEIPNAILGEAFLSFLGLGVQPPAESWGTMAEAGYKAIDVQPWLMWTPAFLIASTVLATVAIADGLRDALDPRGKTN